MKNKKADLDENPLSHHAGALLSLTQQPDGVAHLVATLQNSLDVNAVPPPPREWIGVTSGERPPEMSVPVRVLTYNILCPTYCSRNLYGYCPEWALKWNYRVRGLQHELRECGADVRSSVDNTVQCCQNNTCCLYEDAFYFCLAG